jgi:hypothetical protein
MNPNLEGLLDAIDEAYARPDIVPSDCEFATKGAHGMCHCCALGAVFIAACNGPTHALETNVFNYIIEKYGVNHAFCSGFISGFDNEIQMENGEEFGNGYRLGRDVRFKWITGQIK